MSDQYGHWVFKKNLGRGGFGVVSLWFNEETQENIAIKECQLHNTSDKMRTWWKAEVDIMGRLEHDNLIRALPVPPELAPEPSQPPKLAMEFCEGGDLRKVLNLPQNCLGLSEKEIRQLASGIGSAINYLHKHRITHRDLKPENIVLKTVAGRTLYKIIDLGYAKELDINSLCNSFVGTVKYLAPELFISKPYSKAVDYWSLGVVVYECITGYRPFLPDTPPVEWHREVSKKSPEDISARYNNDKSQVIFSKKLPASNHLCKPLAEHFELWLQLMLRWEPKARGSSRFNCFEILEQICSLQVISILNVEKNSLLSYPVKKEDSIRDIMQLVSTQTEIPEDEQFLIDTAGFRIDPEEPALKFCSDHLSEELSVFLFRAGMMEIQERDNYNLPSNVNTIVKQPTVLLGPKGHRRAWAETVYWITEEAKIYHRLMLAHGAALLNMMQDNSKLLRQKSKMETEIFQLVACQEFFKNSLEFDINKCKESLEFSTHLNSVGGQRIMETWTELSIRFNAPHSLVERGKSLVEGIADMNAAVLSLQRRPDGTHMQVNKLKEFEEKAKKLYDWFIHANDPDTIDHTKMVNLIAMCFCQRDELTKTLYNHIRNIRDQQTESETIFNASEQFLHDVKEAREQLSTLQRQRQETLWSIIRNPHQQQQTSAGELDNTIQYLPSLSSNLESVQLLMDCREYSQKTTTMLKDMLKEQEQSMVYFSSPENNK
ncbi:hypothetical protein EGW08_001434 [Elysia chlorotica]|uniref:IkappaB kinase n=1 Tax=Elysia chlorotica TaxID=188477 RepID=A0A3S1BL20_ELYCH|nr:hypothetical protein EGW08_001434 [Elysia chlorotica]